MDIYVSIVTPTYNRAGTLARLFDSLVNQTNLNFEWIVSDDGSEDGTRELINKLISISPFKIQYLYKDNGGPHTARNLAIQNSNGQFIFFVDSDDILLPNAISRGIEIWDSLGDDRINYWAVYGRGRYSGGELVGELLPDRFNLFPKAKKRYLWRTKYKFDGIAIARADILKENPWPEPEGLKFIVESMLYNELHVKYECLYVNDVFMVYYQDQHDHLTQSSVSWESSFSSYIYYLDLSNRIFKMDKTFKLHEKFKYQCKLLYTAYKLGKSSRDIYHDVTNRITGIYLMAVYPLFCLIWKAMRLKQLENQGN